MPLSVVNEDTGRSTTIRDTSSQDRPVDQRSGGSGRMRWIVAALGIAIMAAVVVLLWQRWSGAERSVARERLRIATVEVGDFVRDVSVQGSIVAAVSPTVYAPAEGTVTLLARAGDTVELNQEVARLESPELSSRLRQEQATLEGLEVGLERQQIDGRKRLLGARQAADLARVEVTAAERERDRAEAGRQREVISQQDYDKASDDLESATLRYGHAMQDAELVEDEVAFELKTLELERDRQNLMVAELQRQVEALSIRSPVAGVIGNLSVEQKAAVSANQPLFTVVDLSAFEAELRVPEAYADDLSPGMQVDLRYGGASYGGELRAVSPEVANNEVIVRVRFRDGTPTGLRQNQRVSATILLEQKPGAVFVQRGPFLDSGNGRVAYVVEGDIATRRQIKVGSVSINAVEIVDGVSAGEMLVISSTDAFRAAETVRLTD